MIPNINIPHSNLEMFRRNLSVYLVRHENLKILRKLNKKAKDATSH